METFLKTLEDLKASQNWSDSDSSYSEDEAKIEQEIKRHNSEDEIDHGPVLQSLRMSRQMEIINEKEASRQLKEEKKIIKAEQRKESGAASVQSILDEATGEEDDQIDSSAKEDEADNFDEDDDEN